jgi:hypothetical protein
MRDFARIRAQGVKAGASGCYCVNTYIVRYSATACVLNVSDSRVAKLVIGGVYRCMP